MNKRTCLKKIGLIFFSLYIFVLSAGTNIADAAEPKSDSIPDSLQKYVSRDEPLFRWNLQETAATENGTVYRLHLVSQNWHDIVWEHALTVYEPKAIAHPEHMLLFVTGGSNGRKPGAGDIAVGMKLAELCQARIATLHQVPNQPLLGNRKEDDLITETWLRYLKTGDDTWPLLFPMVKSAVKAMDALEQFAKSKQWKTPKGFVITGGSKRGWTSWLTPVADKRIVGTVPIVIDVLNFSKQMKHQIATWGKYSEQIYDYTSKGLMRESGEPETPREIALWKMMDPYTYRAQLTLPKLLINGTNDRYWVVDAMKNYWGDLAGPKYILQVPNAGHSLKGGRDLAYATLAAFFRHRAMQKSLPKLEWTFTNGKSLRLSMTIDQPPLGARLWTASSSTKDFRQAKWSSQPIQSDSLKFSASVDEPDSGHVALYGELLFKVGNLEYSLSTQVFRE
ncbi:MAG: phenylacetic acid degradation protein [Planctomycetes bacterium]|nr:phenylacetic acid degradation protein [Planctomycetota bacterium]